ncbi:hypothetical protein [uncultured Leptotrichia sp.]|uniref:hypothetical protein n=1 Tax=uncultured Leptotrichia sp. TaxID=159271 RepID=UPI0025D44233|nr:hypothetical protein [uncultured Leptotrichia sp.]
MGSGKYRITKIARKWDKNENWEKIILKRIVGNKKIKYVNENNNKDVDITDTYYNILSKNNSKFLGSEEQFLFKVNKMDRNIKNDYVIIKDYNDEEFEKFDKKIFFSRKIKVNNEDREKICRNFYEDEREIMKKRLEEAKNFNNIIFNICNKIFKLEYLDYIDEKVYEIFQNEIKVKDVKNLKEAFKQQEKGLETDKLLAISFNKKRNNVLLEFIQKIMKQEFKNQKELENWFSQSGEKYCKEIFKIYSNMSQKEKYFKLLGHRDQGIASIYDEKKETLQRRLKLGDYSKYDLKKYYQKDYKEEAIKELKDKNKEELEREIEKLIKENYKIDELCDEISNLEFSFVDSKKENKDKMSEIIVKIKEHYKNNVNIEERLENKEKYILSMIHNYVKGRYRKCLELQQKENVDFENLEKRIKEIFDSNEVTKKLKKSIINKVNSYKIFEMKFQNPNIESSDDLEILKAEETFLNKLSTAVSKVGYTLNILLDTRTTSKKMKKKIKNPDILAGYNVTIELLSYCSFEILYSVYPEIKKDIELLKGMILFIQEFRQKILHPSQLLGPNVRKSINIKEKDTIVKIHEDNKDNEKREMYNKEKIQSYFEDILEKIPDYFIEKYESNNVFNIYRNFVDKIMEVVKNFNFKENNTIDYLFPKFHKIYKRMCKSENIDDRQNGARKYLLQTIYYYYFQYEIENDKNNISEYLNLYKNKIKAKKISYSYIIDNKNVNNKNTEILYRNIQREGMLNNRLSQMNNEWVEFIVVQFSEFLTNKKLNWILDDLSEYKKKEKLDENDKNKLLKTLKQKMNKKITYSNDSYVFISLAQFLDLKEISNLIHDIKKFIQFREKNVSKYKPEKNKLYIKELRKVLYILKVMLEHKERVIQKHYLESYDENISIIYGKDIERKDIKDIKIKIKNENQEVINQPLYKSGNDENSSWIVLYGIEQAKRNGTFKFFEGFFNLNDDIKLCKENIEKYEELYNEKEENQRKVDEYISSEENNNIDEIEEINNNKQLFYYYKNMIYGDGLKKGYDFINDIYSHYLSWAYRVERDCKIYKIKEYENKKNFNEYKFKEYKSIKNFRNEIAHFNYFQKTNKSLLELLNDFYDIFDYNLKYQRDVQKVINNIFEKYQIVRKDRGPVVFYCKTDKKLKLSENIIPKKHLKYPEIKLIHEKYVEFFKKLFEYKK